MFPLPGLVSDLLSHPLQRVATQAGTYVLQTVGVRAASVGNVILLSETELGVAEACSGLRMMMLFLAVCTATAMLVKTRMWVKVVLVLSAVPIAIAANVVRTTVTGVLHELSLSGLGDRFFHDLAGWFMMPIAVLMLCAELAILAFVFPRPSVDGADIADFFDDEPSEEG
jgi:exosortase